VLSSSSGIDFDHRGGLVLRVTLQFPPALHDKPGSVAADVNEGAFPVAVMLKFSLDVL
jgi:hypothetical protein